ncbi:MAG: hypothetical protein NPIRA01_16590 [Nitrospirales bacterium]|nr:MAG: hypothetical protein NPIRA01_16590 [Nitrospirales bacterium]
MKSNVFLITALGLMIGLIPMDEWIKPLNAQVRSVPEGNVASRVVDDQGNVNVSKKIRNSSKSLRLPVYKPPKGIGAPGGRVGGGTRGNDIALAMLFAMVPDHLGLTIKEQPSLYWYLSRPAPYKMVLTVNQEDLIRPVLEISLADDGVAGIHSVCLHDHNVRLELGKEYQWFVELVVDADSPARNLVAGGRIKRISPPETLLAQLRNAEPQDVTSIYSEAGLWYDAFDSISDLIAKVPDNPDYPQGRNYLLKQIDMIDIIEMAREEESVSWLRGSTSMVNKYPNIPYIQAVVDYQ